MGIKLKAEVKCDECKKVLRAEVKNVGRRHANFVAPALYFVDADAYEGLLVGKGATTDKDYRTDGYVVLCGVECVLKNLRKRLPRLKAEE